MAKDMRRETKEAEFWNLSDLFNGADLDGNLKKISADVDKFQAYKKILSPSLQPEKIRQILVEYESVWKRFSKINAYFSLKFSENTSDAAVLAKMSLLSQFSADMSNKMRFFSLWIKFLDNKSAKQLISSGKMGPYNYYIEDIRKVAPYTKSAEIEDVMALLSMTGASAFSDLYDIFTSDFKFDFNGMKGLTREEVVKHYTSKDPKLREMAYTSVLYKYGENSALLSEIYRNIVQAWHNEGVKIRGYASPINMRNMQNDVDNLAVDSLLGTARKNAGVFTDYFALKYGLNKKQGQKYEFSRFHLYAPYDAGIKENYTYKESKKLVLDTYKNFDSRFYDAAKKVFDARHVHSHPAPKKRGGAFCWGTGNDILPYIMLNHTNTLKDVFTIMHEFGHAIHDVFAMKQPDLLYGTSLPMAETASTFGEMVLADTMLRESGNDEVKKAILVHLLDGQYGTIMRQSYFVMFEQYAHGKIKEGMTKDELDAHYMFLLKEQFGSMKIPELFRHEWNYLPHIYHTPFYCYAYAWGNLLVLALFNMYKKQGKAFIDKYIELLSAGGSKSAADMLKPFGIDPSDEKFWQGGFDIIKDEIVQLKRLSK